MLSENEIRKKIYDEIFSIAQPGDICFFITKDIDLYNKKSTYEKLSRRWMGMDQNDISIWHMGILSKFKKNPRNTQIRPYFIHSTKENGVFEQHISPGYFSSKNISDKGQISQTIMEILRYKDFGPGDRQKIINYCENQIGKPFPKSSRSDSLTYLLGWPNIFSDNTSFSCNSLIIFAFQQICVEFTDRLESAPFFNLSRYIGHPLFSTQGSGRFSAYLRDHHIYQDPRMEPILSITFDQHDKNIVFSKNPEKYSWDPKLQQIYANFL
jgi:hypothetical protein